MNVFFRFSEILTLTIFTEKTVSEKLGKNICMLLLFLCATLHILFHFKISRSTFNRLCCMCMCACSVLTWRHIWDWTPNVDCGPVPSASMCFFCITFALFALHDKMYRPLNGCRSMTSVIVSLCIDSRRFLFSVINKNSTRVINVDKMETCFLV